MILIYSILYCMIFTYKVLNHNNIFVILYFITHELLQNMLLFCQGLQFDVLPFYSDYHFIACLVHYSKLTYQASGQLFFFVCISMGRTHFQNREASQSTVFSSSKFFTGKLILKPVESQCTQIQLIKEAYLQLKLPLHKCNMGCLYFLLVSYIIFAT